WDGEWYVRAYFDDGKPLGSKDNDECKIDLIAQSWSVLSGGGDLRRAIKAIAIADRYLVRPLEDVVLLLAPPFDKTALDPGYIKGYLPGLRENGGQYTHAAVWLAMAHAMLRDGDSAWRILSIINPVKSGTSPKSIQRYGSEPYVLAGDVYFREPFVGRGGWSWYTGSAGWMYRTIVEWLLGIRKEGNMLKVDPVLPTSWSGFSLEYRHGTNNTLYEIRVENANGGQGVSSLLLDGLEQPVNGFPLTDDGLVHTVQVRLDANCPREKRKI
ncbi:MAG TPA: hypothetical protein DD727_00380, partial [Clostridiales bacterium]|nr:hypothetical protein [Clostridiales bacterium]